jgi:hypothetical protein
MYWLGVGLYTYYYFIICLCDLHYLGRIGTRTDDYLFRAIFLCTYVRLIVYHFFQAPP